MKKTTRRKAVTRMDPDELLDEMTERLGKNNGVWVVKDEILSRCVMNGKNKWNEAKLYIVELVKATKALHKSESAISFKPLRSKAQSKAYAHIRCHLRALMTGEGCSECKRALQT